MKVYTYENKKYYDTTFLRKKFPNVSFPMQVSDLTLMKYGVVITEEADENSNIDKLASAKATRKTELLDAFNAKVKGRTEISLHDNTIFMQFDESDCMKVRAAIDLMQYTNQSIGYLVDSDDNKIDNVSLNDMLSVYTEMLLAYNAAYSKFKNTLVLIENASTVSEVEAVSLEV